MTEDERLALEMQAKMSKHNAESANARTNMGGGSGSFKPGQRRKKFHAAKSPEEIAEELQGAKDRISELEGEKVAEEAAAEKAAEEKVIAEAQAANEAKKAKAKPAEASFLLTASEIDLNWGFLKNIVNIDRFFDSGVKA